MIQETDYRGEHADPPDLIERRTKLRFPFDLPVRFRSRSRRHPVAGVGWVRNISSAGALVEFQHEVSVGTPLELNIDWPMRLDGRIPLQLVVVGNVVRREGSGFAVRTERYLFRIAQRVALPAGEWLKKAASA